MQRRKEVNVYEHKPPAHFVTKSVTLCEECRLRLRGRVEVVEFGAESTRASLVCEQCNYEMVNDDAPDPRWQEPQEKAWTWSRTESATEWREGQRKRLGVC